MKKNLSQLLVENAFLQEANRSANARWESANVEVGRLNAALEVNESHLREMRARLEQIEWRLTRAEEDRSKLIDGLVRVVTR